MMEGRGRGGAEQDDSAVSAVASLSGVGVTQRGGTGRGRRQPEGL